MKGEQSRGDGGGGGFGHVDEDSAAVEDRSPAVSWDSASREHFISYSGRDLLEHSGTYPTLAFIQVKRKIKEKKARPPDGRRKITKTKKLIVSCLACTSAVSIHSIVLVNFYDHIQYSAVWVCLLPVVYVALHCIALLCFSLHLRCMRRQTFRFPIRRQSSFFLQRNNSTYYFVCTQERDMQAFASLVARLNSCRVLCHRA